MTLLEMYEQSSSPNVKDARLQKDGQKTFSYMDGEVAVAPLDINHDDSIGNTQTQFKARAPADKIVLQSTGEDTTAGTFLPGAFDKYKRFILDSRFNQTTRTGLLHHYNRFLGNDFASL